MGALRQRTYYYNTLSGEATWTFPRWPADRLPPGWRKDFTDQSKLATRVQEIGRRRPGALTFAYLNRAAERTGLGLLYNFRDVERAPVYLSTSGSSRFRTS